MVAQRSFHNRVQSVDARLDGGTNICLRRVRHSDLDRIEQGIQQLSDQSRYLRFFSGSRSVAPSVIERLASVDGINHLAWGVVNMDPPDRPAIAAAHVFRADERSQTGEFAITVLDAYHGLGVARILMTAIFLDSYCEGLRHLRIDILRHNRKAYGLIKAIGARPHKMEGPVAQYDLVLTDAIAALETMESPRGIADIMAAFSQS